MTNAITAFSYDTLAADVATKLRQTADAIRASGSRQIEEIISTGRALLTAKVALPHGQFGHWLSVEFNWSARTAQRYITVLEAFGGNATCVSHLPTAIIYRLAALPPQVRERVLEVGAKGEGETTLLIVQEAWEAKQAAACAAMSPEARKAKEERERRRLAAERRREAAWEAEQTATREKEQASAKAALALVREHIPQHYIEFLNLAHSSHEYLRSVVQKEWADKCSRFRRDEVEGDQ